jgi:ABC-type dipeptide/oligopeptide/nickel transport system permease subunit
MSPWVARLAAAMLLLIALGGALSGHDVVGAVDPGARGLGPTPGHPLGTDGLGRDVLARVALAIASVLPAGAAAAAISATLGLLAGTAQALLRGVPAVLARGPTEVLGAVPGLVLVLVLCVVGDGGLPAIGLGVGLALAPAATGDVTTALRRMRARGVFEAGRVHGLSWGRLLLVHAWWGACRHRLLARAAQAVGWTATTEATLSYLGGFGLAEPAPSLGNMLAHGISSPSAGAGAWVAPALCLVLLAWASERLAGQARGGRHAW